MQFLVNMEKANQVFNTAPTIQVVTYLLADKTIRLEAFDYGRPMGWGNDVRARVFINGTPLPAFQGLISGRLRPDWLPKGITVQAWNDALSQQFKFHKWG